MKRLSDKIKMWAFKKWIVPIVCKNPAECTVQLRDAIVFQMWHGKISFVTINKWLRATKQQTIKAYVVNNGGLRVFYEMPDADKRKGLGNVVLVEIENK